MNVNSLTKLHSISPGDLEKLQLSAAKVRFEEQSERIALPDRHALRSGGRGGSR
jgi:hypothetical protein